MDNCGRLLVSAATTLDERKILSLISRGVSEVSITEQEIELIEEQDSSPKRTNNNEITSQFRHNDPAHKAVVEFVKLLLERQCS